MLLYLQASSFLRDSQTSDAMARFLAQGLLSEGGDPLDTCASAGDTPVMDNADEEHQEICCSQNVVAEPQIYQVCPAQVHEYKADGTESPSSSTCSPSP